MLTLPEGDPEPFMDRLRIYTLRTAEALEHYATTRWPAISPAWPPPAPKKAAAFLFVAAPPPQGAQAAYLSTRSPSSEREGKQ